MKKNIYLSFFIILIMITALFSVQNRAIEAATDEEVVKDKTAEAEKKVKEFEKKHYTVTVGNFNGSVEVLKTDEYGNIIEKYSTILEPGEKVNVPEGVIKMVKGMITWKDVAQYENMLARETDVIAKFFIENIWRDRINHVLDKVEKNLREKHPRTYKKTNISVRDIAQGLGIDPPIGFLTGKEFLKIPNRFGGRVPNVDISELLKALDPSAYIAEIWPEISPDLEEPKAASPSS